MASTNIDDKQPGGSSAEPPGAGRTDQHSMLAAAHRTVHGPASSDRQAAIGGLEVPVGDTAPPDDASASDPASALIPGAREGDTLTHREAGGAMGGASTGGDIPPSATRWLDERTASEHRLEGGGHKR